MYIKNIPQNAYTDELTKKEFPKFTEGINRSIVRLHDRQNGALRGKGGTAKKFALAFDDIHNKVTFANCAFHINS